MGDTKYFELRLTATTKNLYDYLTQTCLSHGSYLNPIKLGPFVHGWTDNTYNVGGNEVKAIDESLPEVDSSYGGIKWLVQDSDWLDYDPRIAAPKIQYIEVVNMNAFQQESEGTLTYDHPMTESDWEKYFLPDEGTNFIAAPNGRLYLSPADKRHRKKLSVLINDDVEKGGIIAAFNIAFILEVDGVPYNCIIDPLLRVFGPKG